MNRQKENPRVRRANLEGENGLSIDERCNAVSIIAQGKPGLQEKCRGNP